MSQHSGARDPRRHVIIVGGGASGVLLACHLLRDPTADLRVTIVDKRREIGRGIAYSTRNPDHLLNVRAANMSAFPDDPEHFCRWLCGRENDPDAPVQQQPFGDPLRFVPRRLYGDYIASLITPALCDGERPGCLSVVQGECVSIDETSSGVTVALADGARLLGDVAVLATGHETPVASAGCYADPWAPPQAAIPPDASILILGTGLSMVDHALSLVLAGHAGRIVAISRRGLLPLAHRPVEAMCIDAANVPFGAGAAELLRWLRHLARAHQAGGGDWRSVVDGIRPFTQELWQRLSVSARRSFLAHARAWWDVHRHRMAPEVEARIDTALASGRLTVLAAKVCAIEPDTTGAVVRYRRRRSSTVESTRVDRIVECRGAVSPVINPALRSLFERGSARLDPLRIGIDVTADCAVIAESGIPSARLFAVGPLTRAAFWEIIAVPEIRDQCAALAQRIIQAGTFSPSRARLAGRISLKPSRNPHRDALQRIERTERLP